MSALKVQVYQLSGGECLTPHDDDLLLIERGEDRRTQYMRWSQIVATINSVRGSLPQDALLLKNTTTGRYHRVTLESNGASVVFKVSNTPEP